MHYEPGSQTIGFDALTLEPNPHFHLNPPSISFQSQILDLNRVVKMEFSTCTSLDTLPAQKEKARPKRLKKTWQRQEELEYFCAVLIFSYNNPYLTLSWEWWKPKRFYNFLQTHMQAIFGPSCSRTNRQCKTKDQNFKIQHYEKNDNPIDLVDLALRRLNAYVNEGKRVQKQHPISAAYLQRLRRFEDTLSRYKQFVGEMSQPSKSEIELQHLMAYSQANRAHLKRLWTLL